MLYVGPLIRLVRTLAREDNMRTFWAVSLLALAACDSPTYPTGRVLPQTVWTVNYARYVDGRVESAMVAAPDSAGVATLTYRVMCRATGTLHSLTVVDPGSVPQSAMAMYEPDTARTMISMAQNGAQSSQVVGDAARTFVDRAAAAWTVTLYHADGTVHRWGVQHMAEAVATARQACST